MRTPDYNNFIAVLNRQPASRPTLFELFHDKNIYAKLIGNPPPAEEVEEYAAWNLRAWSVLGYDFINAYASDLRFPTGFRRDAGGSVSMNEGYVITDWKSFEEYPWPNLEHCDDRYFQALLHQLPAGMRVNVFSYGGVFENVIQLMGFDNTCIMIYEKPELVKAVFSKVGGILVRYYKQATLNHQVGTLIVSDDWGHKTQTMLSPSMLREYVFPYYEEINDFVHAHGKYVVLHSCGNLHLVMDDIIDGLGFDAKHSFEDVIQPVEEAYEQYGSRIAILGGIDVDYVCQRTIPEIQGRARAILQQTRERGGYALGTGNSATPYIPLENYLALIRTADEK
ncbi:MAG TPA: uroporphyrinogen-III decarboxylase-like protein [Clostridiales bacterium]|nr:uroporphyrinogen-III decarboxylase-like protein [Clostridiales bacterium]